MAPKPTTDHIIFAGNRSAIQVAGGISPKQGWKSINAKVAQLRKGVSPAL